MNWGTKIAITMALFIVLILTLVVVSVRQDFYLVSDDYYKQEIEYQTQIDKMNNYTALGTTLEFHYTARERNISIKFPQENKSALSGEIFFFRPSNSAYDFKVPISADAEGLQEIDLAGAVSGLWRVKISWSESGKFYYNERTIVI